MANMSDYEYQAELRRQRERRRRYEQRRRAHIRKQRLVFGGGGLIILLLLFLIIRGCTAEKQEVSSIKSTANMKVLPEIIWDPEDLVTTPTEAENEAPTITLAAVGDIMCYDEQLQDAMTGEGYNFTPVFTEVAEILSTVDLAVGNLETNIVTDSPYIGKPNFNTPPEMATALAEAGFDVLSTANTYSIQYGLNGLYSTLQNVQQAGMDSVGTYYTLEERNVNGSAVIKDVGGIKVAFLAYTKGVNNMFLPDGYGHCVNLLYDDYYFEYTGFRKSEILADVNAAKEAGADIIVCMLHWGSEYETELSGSQKDIADILVKAGVNVIIGSHSHVVGEVELREFEDSNGNSRQALIAWSLGNFYSFMNREGTMESLILQVSMQLDEQGFVRFSDVDYVPIKTSYDGAGENFRITNIPLQVDKYLSVAEDSVDEATYDQLQNAAKRISKRVGENYQPVTEE